MIGPDLASLGGIRAVVQGYRDGGLFERFPVTYVATHCDGRPFDKARRAIGGWTRAALCLMRLDAPLVHAHSASRASFWRKSVVCWIARALRRPYILHLHGGAFARFYHEECGRLARSAVRSMLAHAAVVIAVSEEWRAPLERICPAARIEILPNAVAVPPRQSLRAQLPGSGRHVLFLGQLSVEKGVLDLVRAFAAIANRFTDATLLCAGHGDTAAVMSLARELGIEARVHCPGWLEPPAKHRALATASLYVLPSYAEGLPVALLEAMAWGLPVIASRVGGIPGVVEHERNGLLVPAGDLERIADALARLLCEPAQAERLGAAARATVEAQFALEPALARLGEFYGSFGIRPRAAPAAPREEFPVPEASVRHRP